MFANLLNIYIYSNFEILSIIMKKVENYKRACKSCTPVYAVISRVWWVQLIVLYDCMLMPSV